MRAGAVKKVTKLIRNGVVGVHADGKGLYLIVKSKTNAHWEKRYQVGYRTKCMGLGSAIGTVSLDEARKRNSAAALLLVDKIDPLATRRAERAARAAEMAKQRSFGEIAKDYFKAHARSWDPKHAQQWARSVLGTTPSGRAPKADPCKALRAIPVASITTAIVADVLNPIWHAHHETASRLRNRIEVVLDMAKARGLRSGDNPAASLFIHELLPPPAKIEKHFAAVPYAEVPSFMAALREREGSAERALEFLLYTIGRTDEILGAVWPEIDLDKRTWTVPAERMKTRKEHVVPLSQPALALLDALPRDDHDLVFLSSQPGRPLSPEAMLRVLRRMDRKESAHGFRSSFSDWAAEKKGVDIAPLHIIEACLSHKIGSAISRDYRHSDFLDKRRVLLDHWAEFVTSPARDADVVPMVRPAAQG
jgi:integrase